MKMVSFENFRATREQTPLFKHEHGKVSRELMERVEDGQNTVLGLVYSWLTLTNALLMVGIPLFSALALLVSTFGASRMLLDTTLHFLNGIGGTVLVAFAMVSEIVGLTGRNLALLFFSCGALTSVLVMRWLIQLGAFQGLILSP